MGAAAGELDVDCPPGLACGEQASELPVGVLDMVGDGPLVDAGMVEDGGGDKTGGPEVPTTAALGDEVAVDTSDSFGLGGARGFPGGEKKYLGMASS